MFPLTDPIAIVLTVLGVILLVPLLFNRLKIPYIIGLIGAGMALGPYGFHVLEYDASFKIFGEVGILYLMFLAGVEIDMYHLRRNYRRGIEFGLLTFAIPMAFGIATTFLLPDCGWLAAGLVGVMFASHTLLTYPIVTRFGLSNSSAAVIAVCGTIVAVLLALIVLAEIVQIKVNGAFSTVMSLFLAIKLTIYAVGWRYAAPWLTRMFMRKVSDGVMRYVYVLAMVLVMSFTAQLSGVASILGAFYAGLLLNRFIPVRSLLMRRIEFVGNAIFIPYFLIGVGMVINIAELVEDWDVAFTAAVMTVGALLSKWIAAFLGSRMLRLDNTEGSLVFGLTSGKAAATIATTMVGFSYGILDEQILNGAVVMILGCCIMASMVTQRSAIKLRMRLTADEKDRQWKAETYERRPLVAVANPTTAEGLMKLTALGSSVYDTHPTVLLFVANSDDPMHRAMGEASLQSADEAATQMGLNAETVLRYDVNTAAGIVNAMKERHCNQLVLGLHHPATGFDTFLGSMEEQLVRTTNRMIIFCRCFVPVVTLQKLFVAVPPKAEYETGFGAWVSFIANLTSQLGAPLEIMASASTQPHIKDVIDTLRLDFEYKFQEMETWDDFIILSSRVSDDDLFIAMLARRHSISFGSMVEQMPAYLNRYFRRFNLLIIYPEQFGSDYTSHLAPDLNALTV